MNSTHYATKGDVAIVRLDNPPVNGLSHALRSGIIADLKRAEADASINAVVIIGSDKAFSGGADIREFGTPAVMAEPTLHTVINMLETSTKPVIAAIGGTCMGGGLELALGCHFRVAIGAAQIALPEVKLGLLPGAGGTQRLPRLIGTALAKELIFTARRFAAQEAERLGIVSRVAPAGRALEAALELAREILPNGPVALRLAKQAVNRSADLDRDAGLAFERECYGQVIPTKDRLEGLAAFREKREPRYRGE